MTLPTLEGGFLSSMPRRKTLAKFIADNLTTAGWPDVVLNEKKQLIKCPEGKILHIRRGEYYLNFFYYSSENETYGHREKYVTISFPKNFDIRKYLYIRRTGNYKLNRESQFKNLVNPLGRDVRRIKLSSTSSIIRFYKDILVIPIPIFIRAMRDASSIFEVAKSYRSSTENYLSNITSRKYSKQVRKRTTYLNQGEFKFLVDKLYLRTKKSKKDFLKYLNIEDLRSIEELLKLLLKQEVLSDEFLTVLNEYFIKERLKNIIYLGKSILSLGTTNLQTSTTRKVMKLLDIERAGQLEAIWQKYFEKYLLYLIFTYKKVFPKVELENIEGDKKYPDFIGINHYNGLDVIEIKTHLKQVLVWDRSHSNFYFSAEMSKAIVQTTNYLDAIVQERFENPEDRQKITQFTDEENLYHPRGIIIISSEKKRATKKGEEEALKRDFTKLRNSLHNIEILTFDEVLNIADEYINNIISEPQNE